MAPVVTPQVIELYIWNHFQALEDGRPAIGAKLYTYAAGPTSTPKTAYSDPWLLVPQTNPIVLNDQGAADIYLSGSYNLRLYNAEDVLLWSVDSFEFPSSAPPPSPGDKIMGSTDGTFPASPGAGVIAAPGLVPPGYRCEGVTFTLTQNWGTSQGLSALLIGDNVANDRFARLTTLTAGISGGQVNFHSDTMPIEPIPYTILIAAEGGLMDAQGEIHICAYWSALPADVP